MKLFRWIMFLPAGLGGAMILKVLWRLSNASLIRYYLGGITGWIFGGIGEGAGALALFYIAVRIVPSKKKAVGEVICLLGIGLGLLTAFYLVFVLVRTSLKSEDTLVLSYFFEDMSRCLIEIATLGVILLTLRRGKLEGWLKESV
jgi:hypothetical protein